MIRGIWKTVRDPLNNGHTTRALRKTYVSRQEKYDENNVLDMDACIMARGKTRDMYEIVGTGNLISIASDRASSGDDMLKTLIPHKGKNLTFFNEYWFPKTEKIIPNHYIRTINDRSILVRKGDRIDIEAIVRGRMYGNLFKEYEKGLREINGFSLRNGLQLAEELDEPIFTPTTKAPVGEHDVDITKKEAIDRGICTGEKWNEIEEAAFGLYDFYRGATKRKKIELPDFKSEYAILEGILIQIDEPPTSDSGRFWPMKYFEVGRRQEDFSLDKEFLRVYRNETKHDPKSELPYLVVSETVKRYDGLRQIFEGKKTVDDISLLGLNHVLKKSSVIVI